MMLSDHCRDLLRTPYLDAVDGEQALNRLIGRFRWEVRGSIRDVIASSVLSLWERRTVNDYRVSKERRSTRSMLVTSKLGRRGNTLQVRECDSSERRKR